MRHPRFLIIATFLASAAAMGCRSAAAPEVPRDAIALDVRTFPAPVTQQLYSGLDQRSRLVIRDAGAWAEFWNEVTEGTYPPPPVPEVDFAAEMVVVAGTGPRPTGGYSIHIDDVLESDGRVWVVVREMSPAQSCIVTLAVTSPIVAVRIPRRDGPVTFIERTGVHHCNH